MPYQLLALARHLSQYGQVELCMNFVLNWYYVIKAKYTLAFRGPFRSFSVKTTNIVMEIQRK